MLPVDVALKRDVRRVTCGACGACEGCIGDGRDARASRGPPPPSRSERCPKRASVRKNARSAQPGSRPAIAAPTLARSQMTALTVLSAASMAKSRARNPRRER